MSISVLNNQTQHFHRRKGTYRRFYINVHIVGKEVNTPFPVADNGVLPPLLFDPKRVTIIGKLKRGGYTHNLCNSNLAILSAPSTINDSRWDQRLGYNPRISDIQTPNTPVYGEYCYQIEFSDFLNLSGDDRLEFEINVGNTAFNAQYLDMAQSTVEFVPVEETGRGKRIPKIEVHNIGQRNANDDFHIGDNIERATFINFDKTTSYTKDRLINFVHVQSNELTETLRHDTLINRRCELMESPVEAMKRNQSFTLFYEAKELTKVDIDIDFEGENISNSNNFVVVHKAYNDARTLAKWQGLLKKHRRINANALIKKSA